MSKAMTAEKLRKIQLMREKEILKWEKEKARPKRNTYLFYLILVISLIYATDEIASQIGALLKTEIANDLFANYGNTSVKYLDILSVLVVPFQAIGLLYRPFADKWGRKIFLIINTIGMSLAMLVIFVSDNLILYFLGACMIQFFIPHDMHVVYIMESAPSKHRARMYSVIKFFANISVMLVPLLRDRLMQSSSEWREVYLVPAIVGIVTALIALVTARETDGFIDSRLRYLRMTDEEREAEKKMKSSENAQGGLIPALKFAFRHRQLRWLYITSSLANLGFVASLNYQPILTYGLAQGKISHNFFEFISEEMLDIESVSSEVTTALVLFSIGSAVAQVIMGFVSDSKGRRTAAIVTASNCVLSFVIFTVGARLCWELLLVGFMCGVFVGSYYSTNDVIIMMVGESSPTNLRSSTMSAQFIVTGIGAAISFIVNFLFMNNSNMGAVCLALLVPGFILALIALFRKTGETKGIDMDTVTGCEWD